MTASLTRTAATLPPCEQMTGRTFRGVRMVHRNPQSGTIMHSESVWVSSKERADCLTAGGINLMDRTRNTVRGARREVLHVHLQSSPISRAEPVRLQLLQHPIQVLGRYVEMTEGQL